MPLPLSVKSIAESDPSGNPRGVSGFRPVRRDIAERGEAAKRLADQRILMQAVFGSVQDAIITVSADMRVIEANASAQTLCGIDSRQVVGQAFARGMLPCAGACADLLRQTLDKRTTIRDFHVACGIEGRHPRIVNASSSPLMDDHGNFLGAVLVLRDITLLRDLERQLWRRHEYRGIVGKSKRMQEIYQLVEDLADLETTVLVTGESGTGKDLVAQALYLSGRRAFKPFVAVNCAALAETLMESELFGHAKGAFPGSVQDQAGSFQAADGGTILLDEIGDVPPSIQLKLLRVLRDKEYERIGEVVPRKVDVRVIACTHKDLRRKVKNGGFREDLYRQLKVVEICQPPLRERLEDIPLLVEHFRKRFNERTCKGIEGVSSEVLARFMDYRWPGNVRELERAIESACVLCDQHHIEMKHLPMEIQSHKTFRMKASLIDIAKVEESFHAIWDALNNSFWNKSKAARMLGISRQTLYRKMREYDFLKKAF